MGLDTVTLEIDGQQFQVDSLWLRDEADLAREREGGQLRDHVLGLLATELQEEWREAPPRDGVGVEDARMLETFEKFVTALDAIEIGEGIGVGYRPGERRLEVSHRHLTEAERDLLEDGFT